MSPGTGGTKKHPQVPSFRLNPSRDESFHHPAQSMFQHGGGLYPNNDLGMALPTVSLGKPSASSACHPYEADYKAAHGHFQELMRKNRVSDGNWKQRTKEDFDGRVEDPTNYFTSTTENMGNAVVGLPSACVPSTDSPLLTPPELSLFVGVQQAVDNPMRSSSPIPDWTLSPSASAGNIYLNENRDCSRRTSQ